MKKIGKIAKWYTLTVVCVLLLGVAMKTECKAAVIGKATGLKQEEAGINSVKITWDALIANDIAYKVELCAHKSFTGGVMHNLKYNGSHQIIGAADIPSETFRGLAGGKKYYVKVTPFTSTGYPEYKITWGSPSDVLEVATAPSNCKIENFRQTKATETSITLSWTKYPGANAYQLVYAKKGSKNGKKTVPLGNVKTYTVSKLSKNTQYQFWLWPVNKSASGYRAMSGEGKYLTECPVLPTKIKEISADFGSPASNQLDIAWRQAAVVDGYRYQIFEENGKKALLTGKKIGNGNSTYFSSSKLKGNCFFKLRVQGYVEIGGKMKTGAWSDWVYFSRQPKVEMKNTKSGIKLTWNKISGATDYTVLISKKRKSGYSKAGSTAKTSMTVSKCGKSNLKSGKQYYVIVVANKKVGKKTFESTRNYCFWRTYQK